jgi:hypothetical protein
MFQSAKPPINRVGTNVRLTARIDAVEDPCDVYRVTVPAGRKVTLMVSADADLALSLWNSAADTVWTGTRGRLAAADRPGKTETVTWTNPNATARVVFGAVRPRGSPVHLDAAYTLQVRVS